MKGGLSSICFIRFCFLYWTLWCLGSAVSGEGVVASQDGIDQAPNENQTASEENVILIEGSKEEAVEEIRSSIEEPDELLRRQSVQVEQSSQNSGIVNEFDGTNQGVPYTLVDTATAEFQDKVNELYSTISDQNETADAFGNVTDSPIAETVLDQPPDVHNDTQEEIPSFSEWTQKQLEQVEKKKEQVNTSANAPAPNGKPSSNAKKRLKNYASPDCGAKLVHANPEAVSAGSVLTASRDEYKLNACTNRIWFIVELCEAIQAKRIDLANFELFSSSPKDFSIYVSDRFPTRDWSSVGHFTAVDERDVQSFDLHPHLFGKYIKFEMHSHYGSEHYCPISLFRVYGTSEFEVLETENQIHTSALEEDDDDDDGEEVDGGKPPQNLFSSAKDAVISMVKKAAEVLGNKPNASKPQLVENSTDSGACTPLISSCTSPSHIVVCDNCSEVLFGNVFELLSCRLRYVKQLMRNSLLKSVLYNSEVCLKYGLRFRSRSTRSVPELYVSFTEAFLPPKYVAAMCNIVAIDECKVVLNDSNSSGTNASLEFTKSIVDIPVEEDALIQAVSTVNVTDYEVPDPDMAMQIQPTKTQMPEALNFTRVSDSIEDVPPQENVTAGHSVHGPAIETMEPDPGAVASAEALEEGFESLGMELSEDVSNTVAAPPVSHQGQKESVFIRLSNRIKALELNMSLSSQYLEELSRRYKKQVEEMQRLLDKTITTLSEQTEQSELLNKKIETLSDQVEQLWECKTWLKILAFLLVSVAIVAFSFMYCCQRGCSCSKQQLHNPFAMDLVSPEHRSCAAQVVPAAPKKSKKRKKSMQRSNSFTAESIEPSILTERSFAPTKTSSRVWQRQVSSPTVSHFEANGIQDIPFVLEESEHSSLDTLVYSSLSKADELPAVANGNLNGGHSSNTFAASEFRSNKRKKDNKKLGHKKSASIDATFTLDAAPMTDSASVSSSLEENRRPHGQKKKGGLKKIFKTFTFK